MKKALSLLFVFAMFICGCQKPANIIVNSDAISNESFPEEEKSVNSISSCSSDDLSTFEPDYGENALVIDSMEDKVIIKMPYSPSCSAKTGEEFAKAMAENPLDKAYSKDMNEWNGSTAQLYDICDKYIELWKKEIDFATESLETVLDANHIKRIKAYSDNFIKISVERIRIEANMFRDYEGTGVDFGSIMSCYSYYDHINIYRDLAFRLKYWMYILETENENSKEADLSLHFVFEE